MPIQKGESEFNVADIIINQDACKKRGLSREGKVILLLESSIQCGCEANGKVGPTVSSNLIGVKPGQCCEGIGGPGRNFFSARCIETGGENCP